MPQQFSDNNIDKAFREKLSGLRVEPRSRVWYRVSAGLDREAALVAHKKRRVIGVLIGVILLTGIILTAVLDPVATRRKVSNTNGEMPDEKSSVPATDYRANLNSLSNNVTLKTTFPSAIYMQNSDVKIKKPTENGSEFSETGTIKTVVLSHEVTNGMFKLQLISSTLSFASLSSIASEINFTSKHYYPAHKGAQKKYSKKFDCNRKIYVGANFKMNRTSFADTSLSQNINYVDKFHIKKSFMIYAGFYLNKNTSIELGWNIFSNEGQSYGYTSQSRRPGAKPTRKDYEIALLYTQVPLKIRYGVQTWSGILKTNVTYSLAIGPMYGRLIRSGFTVGDMDISSQFKKSEISGVGNLAVDISLYRKLSLNTGIEASYSNNIFMKDKRISPFTSPHNLIVGASAGLKYNF